MKKLTLLAFIALFFLPTVMAQKLHDAKVPEALKASVKKQFPSATRLKWEKENENFEASFKVNNVEHSVLLDRSGNILQTEVAIDKALLPTPALAYVKLHYGNKKLSETAKITNADGTVTYEIEVKGKDLNFDSNGNFINETKS